MSRRQPVKKGGIFGSQQQAPVSKETQELMKVMMEESRLTNFQRRKLNEALKDKSSLPTNVPPTSSFVKKKNLHIPPAPTSYTMRGKPITAIRTKQAIEDSGAYERDKFVPKPTVSLEKEKSRLSNIMAFGEDVLPPSKEEVLQKHREKIKLMQTVEIDRFEEIQQEIEERKSFLELMFQTGKGREYEPIISVQISKLIREMEVIDQQRTAQLQQQLQQMNKS